MSLESMNDRNDLAAQWYKSFCRRNPNAEHNHMVEGHDAELFRTTFGETVDEFKDRISTSGMSDDQHSMLFVFQDGSIVVSANLEAVASIFALPADACLPLGLYKLSQKTILKALVNQSPKPLINGICKNANIIFSKMIEMKIEQLQPENEKPC